jgi:hypothetical protein
VQSDRENLKTKIHIQNQVIEWLQAQLAAANDHLPS